MTRDQKIVAAGAASGVLIMAAAMWGLSRALPAPAGLETVGDRLGYALRWDALAAVPLFTMILAIGNARALGPAIDPTLGAEDRAMQINGRVADNTLQQYAIFVVATLALATSLSPARMAVIAAAAIVFTAARILFWIGYRIHPLYRAPGFAATAWLNIGLLGAALWLGFA
jgi:uncharacterized MAPEG superfamily protein